MPEILLYIVCFVVGIVVHTALFFHYYGKVMEQTANMGNARKRNSLALVIAAIAYFGTIFFAVAQIKNYVSRTTPPAEEATDGNTGSRQAGGGDTDKFKDKEIKGKSSDKWKSSALLALYTSAPEGATNVMPQAVYDAGFVCAAVATNIGTAWLTGYLGEPPQSNFTFGVSESGSWIACTGVLSRLHFTFMLGTNTVDEIFASYSGTLSFNFRKSSSRPATNGIPDGTATDYLAPFQTLMGTAPTNGAFLFQSDTNSATFTWLNVFLGRDSNCTATVQAELYASGDFTYRYHLPESSNSYALFTNLFLIGAQNSPGGETVILTNSLSALSPSLLPAFELRWKAFGDLRTGALAENDFDNDGVLDLDELRIGTDPRIKDTDSDGISDGLEIALGTNPLLRDSDNDSLVDGSDPDPLHATSLADNDNDGIPDAYEIHWFGGTNLINSLSVSYTNTGFTVGVQLLGGMNPTNAAADAYSPTNTLVSWNLFGSFACDFGQLCTNVIYERTFTINRQGGWQQYFISASPDRSEPWSLEGMTLEWADSDGTNGTATASPSGDSLRLDLSGNGPASLILRLRANGSFVRSAKPLHLIAWSPEVTFNPSPAIGETNGFQCLAFLTGSESVVHVTLDRSLRPHLASASAEELAQTSDPFSQTTGLAFYSYPYASGGELTAAPGVYGIPGAILSPTNSAQAKLIFTTPRLDFDGCVGGCETHLSYDATSNLYSRVYAYPLDSHCLWEGWHRDAEGAWSCSCEPEFTLGSESLETWLSHTVTRNGDRATAVVSIGSTQMWDDEAWHRRIDTCGEYLSDNGCGGCGGGCAEGNCDEYEGDSLGSLSFRVPLGVPRKGQVSGFLWFRSDGPVTITPALFNVMIRSDASASVTSNNAAVARIVCSDGRGRDVSIQEITYGVRISVTNIAEGALYSAWEVTNPNGDPSCVNFRRTTRLNNLRREVTYTYSQGQWTRSDNISQTSEQLIVTGTPNENFSEDRILRDAANNILSRTLTQFQRVGSGDTAVLRETQRSMLDASGSLMEGDSAIYWTDGLHASRNGKPKRILGATRPWSYQVWDDDGREILKAEQRDGSNMSLYGEPSTLQSLLQSCSGASTVTETSYTVLAGDTDHADDEDKPRAVSVWAGYEFSGNLISRTWHIYTRVNTNGMPAVLHRTIRAASSSATMNSGLNAISTETSYTENDAGIPLLLRGRAASSSDEAGVTTSYSYTFGTFDPSTRVFTEGGATNHVRVIRAVLGAPTQSLTVEDAVQGLEVYSATFLASNGTVLDWEARSYDDQNRQRFSAYSDGTSSTNHYSCCRLIWSRDREGKTVYRNATTGYDHLYYAMEDRSVSNLVGSAVYPVTRHWFDALGRETNTVSESSDGQLTGGNRATSYPNGSSDRSVSTDAHGNFTVTTTSRYQNYDLTVSGQYASGASSPHLVTTSTQYRNGPSVTRREWDNKFTQETRATAFDASGNRIESVAIQASDITGTITNSVTVSDFLGRTSSVTTPLGATTYTYATDRNRLAYTERTGGPATERTDYHYDDSGEQVGTTVSYGTGLPTASSFSVTSYETVSNETWRVTRSSRVTDSVTNSLVTSMEQLTGLGSGIIARSVGIDGNSGVTTLMETTFDPATFIRTATTATDNMTPNVQISKYGYTLTSSGLDGSSAVTYDGLAREAGRTAYDASSVLLSTTAASYDGFGNVITNAVTYGQSSTPDVMTVTSYNTFGRPISTTTYAQDQTVSVVTNGYDVTGALIAQGGDTYPVTFGFDTAGRRTQLTTRYGATDTAVATQWGYSSLTGLLTNKLDAAGKGASYTYTSDGRPLRTAWARGSWKENSYDSRCLVSSSSYSDNSMDVTYTYNAAGLPSLASSALGFSTAYAYSDKLVLTNETIQGLDASGAFIIDRIVDARLRPSATTLTLTSTNLTQVTYYYDAENRLSAIDHVDASVEYVYNGGYMNGCTIALSNGLTFTRTFIRDPYRKHLINAVSNSFDGVAVCSAAYIHDILSRRTNIIYTAQSGSNILSCTYNARSEVTGVIIDTNDYAYSYDNIGNNLFTSLNSVTNAFTVNALNQYTEILYPVNPVNPVYDFDGNMVTNGIWSFTYDAENRLTAAYSNDILLASNTYDHKSRRIRKSVSSSASDHFFIYDSWNLIHETVANTNGPVASIEYVWGLDLSGSRQGAGGVGGLLFEKRNGAIYIPCYDANGNITAYVDTNGTIRAYRQFDAFGNTIAKGGDMVDTLHFWYSTKYLDHDTGLYYYGYRYYSPMLQRWINRDPMGEGGSSNLYLAFRNAPVVMIDALGLCPVFVTEDEAGRVTEVRKATDIKAVPEEIGSGFLEKMLNLGKGGGKFINTIIVKKCDFSIRLSIVYGPKEVFKSGETYHYFHHTERDDSRANGYFPHEGLLAHEYGHAFGYWMYGGSTCAQRVHDKWSGKTITSTDEKKINSELLSCQKESLPWSNYWADIFTRNYFDVTARGSYTRTFPVDPSRIGFDKYEWTDKALRLDYIATDIWKAK